MLILGPAFFELAQHSGKRCGVALSAFQNADRVFHCFMETCEPWVFLLRKGQTAAGNPIHELSGRVLTFAKKAGVTLRQTNQYGFKGLQTLADFWH